MEELDIQPFRTPNEVALKWKQIKYLMNKDLKKLR